jgi:hypothetical protein
MGKGVKRMESASRSLFTAGRGPDDKNFSHKKYGPDPDDKAVQTGELDQYKHPVFDNPFDDSPATKVVHTFLDSSIADLMADCEKAVYNDWVSTQYSTANLLSSPSCTSRSSLASPSPSSPIGKGASEVVFTEAHVTRETRVIVQPANSGLANARRSSIRCTHLYLHLSTSVCLCLL